MKFALILLVALPMVFSHPIDDRDIFDSIKHTFTQFGSTMSHYFGSASDFISKEYHQVQHLANELAAKIDPATGEAGCVALCTPLASAVSIPASFSGPVCAEACHLAIMTVTGKK